MHCKDTILRTQNNWPYSKLIPNSGKYYFEYFQDTKTLFDWLGEIAGKPIQSMEDAETLGEEWEKENSDAYCYINEFTVVN